MLLVNILSILSDSYLRRREKPIKENSSSPSGTVLKILACAQISAQHKGALETFLGGKKCDNDDKKERRMVINSKG